MSRQSGWPLAMFCLIAGAALLAAPAYAFADGYDSPQAAGEAFLGALKAKDLDSAVKSVIEHRRDDFATEGASWFNAMAVDSYEFESSVERQDEVVVRFKWTCKFDLDAFFEGALKMVGETMRADGGSDEEVAEQLAMMRATFEDSRDQILAEMSAGSVGFRCATAEDGRWYVVDLVVASELRQFENEGAIRELAEKAMTAAAARSVGAFADLMHEDSVEEFTTRGGAAMMQATTINGWTVDYVDCWDENSGKAVVKLDASLDRDAAAALFREAMRAELQKAGLSDDDVNAQLDQMGETISGAVESAASMVESGRIAIHVATDSDGNWRIMSFEADEDSWVDPPDDWDPREDEVNRTLSLMLDAGKHRNEDRILALVPPTGREEFVNEGRMAMVLSLTMTDYSIMNTAVTDGEGDEPATATCEVWWSVTFDPERYVELGLQTMREFLTARGLPDNQVEEAVAAAKETLAERAAAMSEQFSGEYMRFSLVQLNGCWYVTNGEPMEEPGMADYGAESPEDAISMLLAGLAEQDWDAVTNMLAPNTHNDTVNTLMSTLTVTGYEIGELREDEDGNYVAPVTITGSLDVEIWADINIEHDLEALHLEGLSADEVEAKRDALTAAWKEKAAALNARLVAGASLEAIIGGTSGGRYVVTQLLGDPE